MAAVVVVFLAAGALATWAMSTLFAPAPVPLPAASAAGASSPATSAGSVAATAAPRTTTASTQPAVPPAGDKPHRWIVVVDAGHQRRPDNSLEPIGPGARMTKPKVASGTMGVVTRNPENVINLAVSLKLQQLLEAQPDVKVVMIRTTPDVNVSNSERARIANRLGADLLIRVHCDGVDSPSVHGLLTMIPYKNKWAAPIYAESRKAGRIVQDATLTTTGAKDRGILEVGNMAGFNYSQVPSVIVEMGVMTNASDDRKLADAGYQDKLAQGMADGVMEYLRSK